MDENESSEIVAAINKITGTLNVIGATLSDINNAQVRQAKALEKIVGRLNVYDPCPDFELADGDSESSKGEN